ncbi:MAG: flagellar motor switch protein FliM [Planctomycetota bacterium]
MPQTLLSQDEIEALLELVENERANAPSSSDREVSDNLQIDDAEILRRDFSKPDRLPRDEYQWLQGEAAHAAVRASDALSKWLRLDARIECVAIETQKYKSFLSGLTLPCVVYPIRFGEEDAHPGAISFDPSLILAAVDRVLGGKGRARFAPRVISAIELPVGDRLARLILNSFSEGFADVVHIAKEMSGAPGFHVRHARFVEFESPVIVVTYSVGGDLAETELRFVIPSAACQHKDSAPAAVVPAGPLPSLNNVHVEVAVRLAETNMTIRELLQLEAGDVVEMDQNAGSFASVEVEGTLVANASVGTYQNEFAVTIENLIQNTIRPN